MKCDKCGYDYFNSGDSAHVCGPIEFESKIKGLTDFDGNQLFIGDSVACLPPHYRCMVKGTVIGFTKKQIVIEYKPHFGSVWADRLEITRREPGYVVKIG